MFFTVTPPAVVSTSICLFHFKGGFSNIFCCLLFCGCFSGLPLAINVSPALPSKDVEWWFKNKEYYESFYSRLVGEPKFKCPVSNDIDNIMITAHSLPPKYIKIIGAIGDSLTAGYGAGDRSLSTHDLYPELPFLIGGKGDIDSYATLPNFIKYFNPDVKGASQKNQVPSQHLNVAVSGSIAHDMPKQAITLLERLVNMPEIRMAEDWKLISIFVGTNDLCRFCEKLAFSNISPASYAEDLYKTVNILKEHLPNTIVNLVPAYDLSLLKHSEKFSQFCLGNLRRCSCLFKQKNFTEIVEKFNSVYETFLFNNSYQTNTYAVVVSESLNMHKLFDLKNPENLVVMAPDCFHFSEVGHDAAAKLIWNNLMTPFNDAKTDKALFDLTQRLPYKCPDPNCPFIRTIKNSAHCYKKRYTSIDQAALTEGKVTSNVSLISTLRPGLFIAGVLVVILLRRYRSILFRTGFLARKS